MHLVGDDQRRPRKHRTKLEKIFKNANSAVLTVQFGCLLVIFAQILVSVPRTYDESGDASLDFWFGGTWSGADPVIEAKKVNCSYSSHHTLWGFSGVDVTVDADSINYLLAKLAGQIRFCVLVLIVLIVASAVNRLFYDLNRFEFKLGQIVLHKEVLTFLEMLAALLLFVSLQQAELTASLLRKTLKHCGVINESSLPFICPLVAGYVAIAVGTAAQLVAGVIHLRNTLTDALPPPPSAEEIAKLEREYIDGGSSDHSANDDDDDGEGGDTGGKHHSIPTSYAGPDQASPPRRPMPVPPHADATAAVAEEPPL